MTWDTKNDSAARLPDYFERESFTDCTGERREFEISITSVGAHGYSAFAREITTREDGGYIFRAFAESSLTMALARVRGAVRAGLAQRYLIRHDGELDMPLERLRGRIDQDGVVVDGQLLDWSSLQTLLRTYEGWEFELSIPFERSW